jgi:preprotein translocase subunit SecG
VTPTALYGEDDMKLALQIGTIVFSLLLVLLVLLHRGRGGGLSSLFGGGMQSSLSGSASVEKNLDRFTLFVGALWLICIVGIGLQLKFG